MRGVPKKKENEKPKIEGRECDLDLTRERDTTAGDVLQQIKAKLGLAEPFYLAKRSGRSWKKIDSELSADIFGIDSEAKISEVRLKKSTAGRPRQVPGEGEDKIAAPRKRKSTEGKGKQEEEEEEEEEKEEEQGKQKKEKKKRTTPAPRKRKSVEGKGKEEEKGEEKTKPKKDKGKRRKSQENEAAE